MEGAIGTPSISGFIRDEPLFWRDKCMGQFAVGPSTQFEGPHPRADERLTGAYVKIDQSPHGYTEYGLMFHSLTMKWLWSAPTPNVMCTHFPTSEFGRGGHAFTAVEDMWSQV